MGTSVARRRQMRIAVERVVQGAETLAERRGAVDIEGSALGIGDRLQLDAVAHERTGGMSESSHESTNDYTT